MRACWVPKVRENVAYVWMMYTLVPKLFCYLARTGSTKNVQLPGYKNIIPAQFAGRVSNPTKLQQTAPAGYLISQQGVVAHLHPEDEEVLDVTIRIIQLHLLVD